METGKVLAPFRSLFGLIQTKSSKDRDPQQGGQGYSRRYPNRRPTKEEAEKVQQWLSAQESIQKNGLDVALEDRNGVFTVMIRDAEGKVLKSLFGDDIFRLLEAAEESADTKGRGSILDRRI